MLLGEAEVASRRVHITITFRMKFRAKPGMEKPTGSNAVKNGHSMMPKDRSDASA